MASCLLPSLLAAFIMIKPDGVQRGLVAEIIGRFEKKGYKLVGLKLMQMSREQAEKHYGEHAGKPFFGGLVEFITSGPIVGSGRYAASRSISAAALTSALSAMPGIEAWPLRPRTVIRNGADIFSAAAAR